MTATPSRSWCFTINNYTDETEKCIKAVPCQRIIAYKEVASTGTPHIQGAIVFKRPQRLNAVKLALGGKAHLEVMRGKWADQDYCMKEGREMVRMEDNTNQGQRTDLKRFYDDISQELPELEVATRNLGAYCKYQRAYKRIRALVEKESTKAFRNVKVKVIVGKTGAGKTKRVLYGSGEDVCIGPSKYNPEWWDGYEGEKAILIDDFYGQLPISRMLRILDGHRLNLPVKGGFRWAKWTKVYITSNNHPDSWYSGVSEEVRRALMRRIDEITIIN